MRSAPVDGFRLAYERSGSGPPVVLLHGWPGDRTDYEALAPLLTDRAEVIVPDLRGFGASDKHPEPPAEAYSAAAQARSVVGLIEELGLEAPVIAGYDVGSRIAQAIARDAPQAVRALVVSPPLPGAGDRVLTADSLREFWYQASISSRSSSRSSTATPRRSAPISRTSGTTGPGRDSSRPPSASTTSRASTERRAR